MVADNVDLKYSRVTKILGKNLANWILLATTLVADNFWKKKPRANEKKKRPLIFFFREYITLSHVREQNVIISDQN